MAAPQMRDDPVLQYLAPQALVYLVPVCLQQVSLVEDVVLEPEARGGSLDAPGVHLEVGVHLQVKDAGFPPEIQREVVHQVEFLEKLHLPEALCLETYL